MLRRSSLTIEKHNAHPVYRPDIDGLRAVAILSVVMFHAFPAYLPGGFAGVDVFFVISGYLISTIIFRSLYHGDFSISEFYIRRARRIFPALILVLLTCLGLGWFVLLPDEFKQLGKHVAGGAGFVQNILLWREAGYFDTAAETKPLLHLWSLAIEEQFYLIFPAVIFVAWRAGLNMLAMVVILAVLSFLLNILGVVKSPVATFFMPYSRIWELLAGSVLAYLEFFKKDGLITLANSLLRRSAVLRKYIGSKECDRLIKNSIAVLGLLLIVTAVLVVSKVKAFPGWWALLPVIGAFLVILAGPEAWINRAILANRLAVFVGLISYPLYLWHWPVLSFARIVASDVPSREIRIYAVLLSFFLAWLTYRLIEKPIRFSPQKRSIAATLAFVLIGLGAVGYYISQGDGFVSRRVVAMNPLANSGEAEASDLGRIFIAPGCGLEPEMEKFVPNCLHDPRGKAKFALIGDSKAWSMRTGVFGESSQNGYWLLIGGYGPNGANVPVISDAPQYASYQKPIRLTIASLAQNKDIKVVVFTAATRALFRLENIYSIDDLPASKNFDIAFAGLDRAAGELIRAGKQVVVTVDNPTLKDPKQCISRVTAIPFLNQLLHVDRVPGCSIDYGRHLELSKQYRLLLENLRLKYPGKLHIFDPLDLLCDMESKVCSSSLGGRLLYSHSDHISQYASFRIAKRLVPFVEKLEGQLRE